MKTKVLLLFSIALISASIFTGCKKYDEGPALSLRSKQHRVEGEWNVTSLIQDGVDGFHSTGTGSLICLSGSTVNYTEEYNTTSFVMTFSKHDDWTISETRSKKVIDYNASYNSCTAMYAQEVKTYTDGGTWKFISDKEKLELSYGPGDTEVWEIKMLKEKEMKLERTDGGSVTKITLVKR